MQDWWKRAKAGRNHRKKMKQLLTCENAGDKQQLAAISHEDLHMLVEEMAQIHGHI